MIDQRIETAIEHGELSEDNDDPMLLWIGTTLGELPTLEELQRARCFADTARVASFATIPNDIVEQLQSDYDQRWSQTESGLFRD